MEILGVGPLELLFIILIALIVLGPNDMIKAGRTIGRFLRNLVTSPTWRTIQETSRDLRYLPNKLMRDAGLEEPIKEISQELKEDVQQISQELKSSLPEQESLTLTIDPRQPGTTPPSATPPKVVKTDQSDWTTPPTIIESPPASTENPNNSESK